MIVNYCLVDNEALSGTIYSDGILNSDKFSFHGVFSGNAVGILTYEVSNDVVKSQDQVINWADYDSYSLSCDGVTQVFDEVSTGSYRWIRMRFVTTSGSGFVTVNLNSITRRQR